MPSERPAALVAPALAVLLMPGHAAAEAAEGYAENPIVVVGTSDGYRAETAAGTRTPTPLLDTPQSVTVVSREQLDDQGIDQLADALRYVPGVTLAQGEGHRDQVVLRGQSSTADFFLDGLRDDAQYYRPLYNTQRIEVLKGANALLFGRGGGGGIVNRVSRQPDFAGTAATLATAADSFGAWSIAADANLPLAPAAALRIAATYEALDNHRDGFGGHFAGVSPTLAVRLGDATRITAAYTYDSDRRVTDRGVPSLGGEPLRGFDDTFFGDPAINRSRVDAHIGRVRIDHEFGGNLTLTATGQYAHYDKFYANIVPGAVNAAAGTVALTGYRSGTVRDNWIGQANLVWTGSTGPFSHTVLAGLEAGDQNTAASRDDARLGGSASMAAALARRIAVPEVSWIAASASRSGVRTLSAYVQDQIGIGDHLQLIAGVRRDGFRIAATDRRTGTTTGRSDGKWSPRLGLVIKPVAALSLYASYARSFLPQSGDQFTTLAPSIRTLAPEAFRNLEAGVKWDAGTLALTAAAFQVDRSNTRANDPLTGNPVLTGKSRVRGFEAALAGRITPAWQATLGYAYQDGEIRTATAAAPAGRRLDKLPRHQVSAWSRYDLARSFGLGLGVVHQSSQFATISNAVRLPSFTRVDAAVFVDLSDRIALQLNVENLLDAAYYPSAHTDNNIATGEPVNARLTARLRF